MWRTECSAWRSSLLCPSSLDLLCLPCHQLMSQLGWGVLGLGLVCWWGITRVSLPLQKVGLWLFALETAWMAKLGSMGGVAYAYQWLLMYLLGLLWTAAMKNGISWRLCWHQPLWLPISSSQPLRHSQLCCFRAIEQIVWHVFMAHCPEHGLQRFPEFGFVFHLELNIALPQRTCVCGESSGSGTGAQTSACNVLFPTQCSPDL